MVKERRIQNKLAIILLKYHQRRPVRLSQPHTASLEGKMSIISTFEKLMQEEPISSFIAFEKTVDLLNLNDRQIDRYFNKLVDKSDYSLSDKDRIIKQIKGRLEN